MLEELTTFETTPDMTLMIGDTTRLQMAKKCRYTSLGTLIWLYPKEMLVAEAPIYCADNIAQLAAWLEGNSSKAL